MLRKLGWLAVGLFVVADAVLITLALRHIHPDQAASGPTTVTLTTRAGTTSTSSSHVTVGETEPAASPPTQSYPEQTGTPRSSTTGSTIESTTDSAVDGATDSAVDRARDSTVASIPSGPAASTTASSTTDNSATGSATSTSPAIGATSTSTTGSSDPVTAWTPVAPEDRLLLDMSSDGHLIRAIRGSCPAQTPTTVEVSSDGGATWSTADTDTPVVLRLGARRGGNLWYVGTDAACHPLEQDTSDGGTTWTPTSTDGTWFLDPDPASPTVHGPESTVDAGCAPLALAGIDDSHAVIACDDGKIRTTDDAGATWSPASTLPGVVSLSFISAGDGFALTSTDGCGAQVLGTTTGGASWQDLTCLTGSQPRGIAAAGDQVVAQVGQSLYASGDGGVTWSAVR